jgi:PAS domain S-box-containing protein
VDSEISARAPDELLAAIDDVLWCYSLAEGRLVYLHPAAQRIHGRPAAALLADPAAWREAVHPDDRERFADGLERGFAEGAAEIVYRVVRPDGEVRWLHDRVRRGPDATLVGVARDVTDRTRAEGAELMPAIVTTVSEGLAVLDQRGRCTVFNPQMEAITGYTRVDAEHPRLFARLFPDRGVRAQAVHHFVRAWRGHDLVNQEWRITRKDRRQRDILISTRILAGPQRRLLAAVRDVTDRHRLEAERWVVERRLREAERLESLGVMAGGIAHDFNNLLQTILGFADVAAAALAPDSPALPALAQVQAAGQRAAELTRQMLAYAGRTRFVPRVLDLSQVALRAEPLLRASLGPGQRLALEAAEGLPPVDVDAAQIRQVLVNLVANACESLGEHGGRVVVRTGVTTCDAPTLAACYPGDALPPGLYVFVEVEDDGCGIPETTRARLFDPFFSTKFTGRGLGLAAVLGIVRGHRGAISVASAPRAGTVMRVLLPPAGG